MTTKKCAIFRYVILFAFPFLFVNCAKEKDAQPEPIDTRTVLQISDVEIGTNDSRTAYVNGDLHLEAKVTASTKIKQLKLQITPSISGHGWIFGQTFTENVSGAESFHFHEHIYIPENARAGVYDVLFIAYDENGEQIRYKGSLTILKDPLIPQIANAKISLSGDVLAVTADIKIPSGLQEIYIEVQSAAWTRKYAFTEAELVGLTNYTLNKTLNLAEAPSGHYHIHISVTDREEKRIGHTFHVDK